MQKRLDSRAEMREDLPPLHAVKRFGKRAVTGMGACVSGMWWDVVIMTFLLSGGGDFKEAGGGDNNIFVANSDPLCKAAATKAV